MLLDFPVAPILAPVVPALIPIHSVELPQVDEIQAVSDGAEGAGGRKAAVCGCSPSAVHSSKDSSSRNRFHAPNLTTNDQSIGRPLRSVDEYADRYRAEKYRDALLIDVPRYMREIERLMTLESSERERLISTLYLFEQGDIKKGDV
ncbi:hypothetical protein [Caballeronia sp. GAOx1]|uniref:hypothetical protein n=1 Tax=Caballeronia sp. GAOx1 TaxID=2921761 RepID=UPI002028D474|nr:hypothetical protein [Caballeronia sp. GAOx1]